MVSISISIHSNSDQVQREVAGAVVRALEIAGGMAESYAKEICPVDTGNLRNSITHQMEGEDTAVIGSAVVYAPYVELGTRRQKAQPYLAPAVEGHISEYRAVFEDELSKIE